MSMGEEADADWQVGLIEQGWGDVEELIADIKEMARRVGGEFIPDPKKIAAFRGYRKKR